MIDYDSYGPEKVLEVYHPKSGMRGFVVIDNTALGPAKGGVRMTPTVSPVEVSRLARAMTWKNALADLPFGGGKAGIVANDKHMTAEEKEEFVREFAEGLKVVCPEGYVAAPDMNMAEDEMRIFAKTIGDDKSCTGKPKDMGGLPHELGSTGFGVFHATKVACEHKGLDLKDVTFAVEGFGNVGQFAAKYLTKDGAKLVAVSDSRGMVCNMKGIDYDDLFNVKNTEGTVTKYECDMCKESNSSLDVKADVLITAAIKDLVKPADKDRLKFKLVVQGSNIPMSHETEDELHKKGMLIIPDFVANAGGVISSYVEFIGGSEEDMWKMVEEKVVVNTKLMLKKITKHKCPREAAYEIAEERLFGK